MNHLAPAVAKINSSNEGDGLIDDDKFFVVSPEEVVDVGTNTIRVTEYLRKNRLF